MFEQQQQPRKAMIGLTCEDITLLRKSIRSRLNEMENGKRHKVTALKEEEVKLKALHAHIVKEFTK